MVKSNSWIARAKVAGKNGFIAVAALAGALLAGCAGTIRQPEGMRIMTAADVAHCRLLGDVHGVSGLYGVFAGKGLQRARSEALEQARQLGANAVVWSQVVPGHGSSGISGLAYSCP